ncbi:MAG TPA: prolyl-tRNA synthetase associated domain-containing protein, partial [Clostridium sp.]|nr:prolyl-tRNA synthetase associated domain-containing protein [Clostridium sp.]
MYDKKEIKKMLDEKGFVYEWVEHEAAFTIEDMVRMGFD